MTAIQARADRGQNGPRPEVVLLDGAARPGAKILVSGGSRCNVTNTVVSERDFWGGKLTIVRRVLRTFPVDETVRFFDGLGVALREEPGGKLFPVSNRSRDVLDALLRAVDAAGVELLSATRVTSVERRDGLFEVASSRETLIADVVVLATGGQSLPKTGSDGAGYGFARAFGHTIVTPTPALAPLLLDASDPYGIHRDLSGVSQEVEISVWIDDALSEQLDGAMLWAHFGVSGPVMLNASRHWERAKVQERRVRLTVNFFPGRSFSAVDEAWIAAARSRPTATVRSTLAGSLPDAVAAAIPRAIGLDGDISLANLSREDRRRLVHALVAWPLPVTGTRGYNYAEVTAGGVPLTEIDPSTMESRLCPGLFLVGEILDVDGRIGGFNFQWSWATGKTAGRALAARSWTPLSRRG